MESLSRPPHRRKHSTATNSSSSSYSSFSFRRPYDDVLLSKGAKPKFEAHEYAEIFAGSSSIPVLELSALNEPLRPSASRSPNIDYSNIFGGFRDDDVALFTGAHNKTKTPIPAEVEPPFHDPKAVNSSGMTERSSDASDQSNDGLMQQFNMSFSRTDQRNNNESNGKTHIAQLHAVPGFTHFVDETPHLKKKDYERPVRPIKHEVSRTWSFSSDAEPITVKGVIASEKSHIPDKSYSVNGINLKSHISKVPPPSSQLNLRQSSLPSFASKDDSKKTDGENPLPFLDEELDENSFEAVSAAALKKAIDQAQESIRIAKMVMEKRKEGLKDGPKPRSKKVKDKRETRIHHVPDALKENNCLNARKAKVETVRENVEAANDRKDAFTEVVKKFSPSWSESAMFTKEKVEVDNIDYSTNKVEPCMEQMETTKKTLEESELTFHQSEGLEMGEHAPNSSQSVVEALEQCQVTVDRIEGTAGWLGRLVNCCESKEDQEKIMHGGGGSLRINLTGSNGVVDDKEECRKEFVKYEGELKFEFCNLQNGLILEEKDVLKQPDLGRKPENVSEWKENNLDGKSSDEKENQDGKSCDEKENNQDGKSSDEEENYQEEEVGKVNALPELEIVNKKLNSEVKVTGEDVQNEIADTPRDSSEYEAAENMQMETDDFCDIEKSEIPRDVDEVNDIHRGSRRNQENQDKFEFQVVDSGKDVDEVIDAHCSGSDAIFTDSHVDSTGVTQEPCDVGLKDQAADRGCKGNDSLSLETKTLSEVEDNGNGVGKTIHLEVNKMPRTDGFPNCASEEKFIESQPNSTFKGLSSDYKCVNLPEFHTNDEKVTEVGITVKPLMERTSENQAESLSASVLENIDEVPTQACRENLMDNISNEEDGKDSVVSSDERECVGEQVERLHCEPKEMEKSMEEAEREVRAGQKNEENQRGISAVDAKRNDHETNERIEAIKRGREREKDKKAAERAIREARERAFAEARERAERARQRGVAEAQDKHDKASVENKKPADKAKLRAERAAVERATNEARERALEKAMSQKTYTEARTQTDRSSTNKGLKHSFSSSDLETFDGASSESAQWSKARLERHQRIMERAAKALAEKNMRDVLAQKEQAERNRLAESLDADIKRWATGKEGNLRALLSTLQYILGPDSGWQPVSLTEIITTAAVKKGYRKATLCVHPDKLQQRGATIQQKYICEKVFDLLKAAWNRFNSEER